MIGAGAIAVAGWVAKAAPIEAWVLNALLILSFVASFLTVSVIAAAVTVLFGVSGLLLGGAYLMFKVAQNILLVVGKTQSDACSIEDYVESGVRTAATSYLPAVPPSSPVCWGGFFIYTKKTVGFYGTALFLTLNRKRVDLSIGMDCRNSLLGGSNSIIILKSSDVKAVESRARGCHDKHGEIEMNTGKSSVKIASKYGNGSWGYCIMDRE
ncbi:hypothetical protein GJ744_006154 [Endocarpon pusillum]|uniref:Uncharacterized protein n=1 Tax=Endocarpon pusillum TaxID=364733 RepID=A0A8H7DWU4_9EURO|nr:hypothetical protein GJ744_006154 [Endocarpon pusillum]